MPEPYLRKANIDDTDMLFRWVNDNTVRENAFKTQKIEYDEHIEWFTGKLNSPDCAIYIYCQGDVPIGQGRIDVEGDCGVISYSIDSAYRLQGHGRRLLNLLESVAYADLPHVKTLVAYVKNTNIASQHLFIKLGYTQSEKDNHFEYRKELYNDTIEVFLEKADKVKTI